MERQGRRAQIRSQFRQWRAAASLSQLDVAEAAGINSSRYWRLENGYAEPTTDEQLALENALHLQPGAFVELVARVA